MNVNEYITISQLPSDADYQLAVDGLGFVVPGDDFLTSISPDEPINYISLLRYTEGEKRANHYHLKKHEYLVILDGTLACEFYLPNEPDERIALDVEAGSIITIKPGCWHIFTAVTSTATALELSPQKLDLTDQIVLE